MKKGLLIAACVLVVLPLTLWATLPLWGEQLARTAMQPSHRRHEDPITVPPDYNDDRYWASLPGRGLANLAPEGQQPHEGEAAIAVFYIHPTSYYSRERWNAPLFENSFAWEMVDYMMASQASAFNACCDVYAPHYREATLWSFFERETDDGLLALDIAYMDVARAFDEFMLKRRAGRPFIIASHSQGTTHAMRLLIEKVNDSALRDELVAAYLIGYLLPEDIFERELTNIPPCENPSDTQCVIHWATYGDQGGPDSDIPHWYSTGWEYSKGKKPLCTNPLSWRRDEDLIPASMHPGALPPAAGIELPDLLFNRPTEIPITGLAAVVPHWTSAQCREGILYVEPQTDGQFVSARDDEKQSYHTRDYALFYQAIRDNAVLRSAR